MLKAIIGVLRRWTLPVAMATGTVVYLIFAFVPALDAMGDRLMPVVDTMLPLFMALILFTNFCRVNFHSLRVAWWHVWITVFQLVLVVALTAVVLSLELSPAGIVLAEGVLTCVIGPGAAAAAVVTAKLGGDIEAMTSYTFVSNIVTALAVPLVFPLIDPSLDMPFLTSFAQILWKVALVLLVPMLGAYIVKHHMPRLLARMNSVEDLSFYMWGLSLSIVTGFTVRNIVHADTTTAMLLTMAAASAVLCVVQFAVGRYIGHFFAMPVEGGQALGQKNTAFAIWIAYTYLSPLSSVVPGCYILWQNLVNSLELARHGNTARR